jgi:hypothetical protein
VKRCSPSARAVTCDVRRFLQTRQVLLDVLAGNSPEVSKVERAIRFMARMASSTATHGHRNWSGPGRDSIMQSLLSAAGLEYQPRVKAPVPIAAPAVGEWDADHLVTGIRDMLLVLRSRYGLAISEAMADERARNVACLVILTSTYQALGGRRDRFPPQRREPEIEGAA